MMAVSEKQVQAAARACVLCPPLRTYYWGKQMECLRCQKETRLLAWANRCGKTTIGAAECVLAGMNVHPYLSSSILGQSGYPEKPFTIWAVSNSYKQMQDSIIPSLEGDATHPRMLPPGVGLNQQRMEYVLPTGSKIRLKSTEAGRDAFQGAAIPLVWLDEDIDPVILKEIFIRIGPGFKRRILWTLTSVNGLTYSYHYFYKPWLEAQNKGFDHPDIHCSIASMDENPYLSQKEIDGLLKFYPPESKEYVVRRYGGFHDIAGDSVFPEDKILLRQADCRPGEQYQLRWGGDKNVAYRRVHKTKLDMLTVNVWERPRKGLRYAIGADVAEGKQSDQKDPDSARDYSAASIFCRDTRTYVATFHARLDPHSFGFWLWLMGTWYNDAWICPELNNNGVAVLGVLRGSVMLPSAKDLPMYPCLYARETHFDQYGEDISEDLLGWKTTTITRPKMISDFYTLFTDGPVAIYDRMIIEEAKSFQRDKQGKAQHSSGFHDDLLISAMLALQADLLCPADSGRVIADTAGDDDDVPFDPSVFAGRSEGHEWEDEYEDEEIIA